MKYMFLTFLFSCFGIVANAESLQGCFHYEYISDLEYYGEIRSEMTDKGLIVYDQNGIAYVILSETEYEICFVQK